MAVKGIQDLQDRYHEKRYNARGKGLMVAFDLKDTAERDRFIDKLYRENNMLAIKAREKELDLGFLLL